MKNLKTYSYQQVCNLLCEACKLNIPLSTHVFDDKSYRLYHLINGRDITCDASEWRRRVTPVNGEIVRVIIKKKIKRKV